MYNKYLRYRNTYNIIKRQTKYTRYENLLNRYQNDIRKTWRVLNNITGRSHDTTTISDTFVAIEGFVVYIGGDYGLHL